MFEGFLNESIIKRAQDTGVVEINVVNLRDFAIDDHGTVDDRPYGGGAGMVLMVEPIEKALASLDATNEKHPNTIRLLTSPRGSVFDQETAVYFSKRDHIIILAGHYEAVDERVMKYFDKEISIGDYVLTGGELPAAIIIDAVSRLLPGVLKKDDATEIESFEKVTIEDLSKSLKTFLKMTDDPEITKILNTLHDKNIQTVQLLEYPHYTRPFVLEEVDGTNIEVPDVLRNGNHAEIHAWQRAESLKRTFAQRPDLLGL